MDDPSEMSVVQLRDMHKVFDTERVETYALSDVTMDIRRGEYLLIQGPSGCGKSTLLSILGLLDTPSSGDCRLEDTDTRSLGLTQRARLRNLMLGLASTGSCLGRSAREPG